MTEQEYKQSLNLIQNSVFTNIPLQWVESFQPGIGQIIANIEREVVEWADLNKPIWDSDPAQSGTYNAVKNELLAFAQNLQKYKDDPARSEVIYDFINAARSLYSFNKNYGLDTTPLTNAVNPFKLSVVSSRVTSFGYMHFKSLSNLVKFNEDLLASIDDEKIQLKGYTKTVLEPVREKLYKLITEDPEFKNLLDELGFGEVDDFIQSFAPNAGALEALTDEFFSNFNTFVGNISARLDTERETTDLAIADARAAAQESIDEALGRVDNLVADLSTYQTGVNTQIQSIQSAYESLNSTVQSNVSRIDATEAAIIQEATTRADGFVATTSQINAIVSRIDDVDASIIQEANTRASEDAATVDRIDQLVTRVDDNAAAIVNEQNARTTALLAEATARETLAAQLKADGELYASGLVTSEANVRASQDEILGERIDLVSAEVGGISTAILNEQTARITGDEAEATSRKALSTKLFGTDVIDGITVDTLTSGFLYDQQQSVITQTESAVTNVIGQIAQIETDLTNTRADLLTETTTRVNEYGAIATSVTALSTEFNNQKATLDSLNSIVSGPDGITTQWGIKSDINGYITGVGLISSSKYGTPTSQFIVYADQFALVTPGVNGGQPTLPFFVGSEQGYLELSNTVKSNWNNVIGDGKPEDGATVGADWYNNVTNRPDPTSFLETFESGSVAQWTNHSGTGELSVVSVADSLTGGKVLRIGNNSGNDQAWLIHKQNIPFNPSALYRIKFRVRRTAGTGVVYLGLAGVAADGVTWVNTSGANDIGSQHYVAASNVGPSSTWTEYVGYVKGTAATGQSGTNPPVTAPLKLHQNVKYIRPLILANYNGAAGITEVDYCSIELMTDAMSWDVISGSGKDTLIATASTALTNANAAQAAANTANNTLADIASDNKLTPVEKQSAANEWGIINRERAAIQAQASALGISGELNDYNYTYAVLNDYITPLLADLQNPSAIDGPTFRDKWSYFYEYRQRLMNKMSAVAATKADWASVTGSGKPANDATRNPISQGALSARPVGVDGEFYYANDTRVMYQKINGAWVDTSNNTYVDTSGNIQGVAAGAGLSVANNEDGIIRSPGGGKFRTTEWLLSGAIKIGLPTFFTSSMLSFAVDIFEYEAGYSCRLLISGYNYSAGTHWYNVTARVIGGSNVEYPVYFGHDGTRCCVWIGNPTSASWNYPQVTVSDVHVGYYNTARSLWENGWTISFDTTAITSGVGANQYSSAVLDTLPGADWQKISGSGKPLDNSGRVIDGDRFTNPNPADFPPGETFYLKQSTSVGVTGAGTYGVLRTVRPYGTGADLSGGGVFQWFEAEQLVWARKSTNATAWSSWQRVPNETITASNVSTYIANAALGNAQIGGNLWSTNWNYAGGTGWLLDRSGNFYGNNIYARGDIEASSLKANTAMVNTLHINGNAVTVPVTYTSTATIALAFSAWTTVGSAYINPEGAVVFVHAFAQFSNPDSNSAPVFLRVVSPSGAVIAAAGPAVTSTMNWGAGGATRAGSVALSGTFSETGTYTIQMHPGSNINYSAHHRALLLLASKR